MTNQYDPTYNPPPMLTHQLSLESLHISRDSPPPTSAYPIMEPHPYASHFPRPSNQSPPETYGDYTTHNGLKLIPELEQAEHAALQMPDTSVLYNFLLRFGDGSYGGAEDFKNKLKMLGNDMMQDLGRQNADVGTAEGYVVDQMQGVRNLIKHMGSIIRRYELHERPVVGVADEQDPSMYASNFPVTDDVVVCAMVNAQLQTTDVYDMAGTKPWMHWRRMKPDDFYQVANRALTGIKRVHAGHDHNEVVGGYTMQQRIEDVVALMARCKGSVVRMHRPSTLEEVITHPRKMRQRFVDNQINNMRKKGEKGDYVQLRAMINESSHLNGDIAGMDGAPSIDDYGDDEEPSQTAGKKRRRAPEIRKAKSSRTLKTMASRQALNTVRSGGLRGNSSGVGTLRQHLDGHEYGDGLRSAMAGAQEYDDRVNGEPGYAIQPMAQSGMPNQHHLFDTSGFEQPADELWGEGEHQQPVAHGQYENSQNYQTPGEFPALNPGYQQDQYAHVNQLGGAGESGEYSLSVVQPLNDAAARYPSPSVDDHQQSQQFDSFYNPSDQLDTEHWLEEQQQQQY